MAPAQTLTKLTPASLDLYREHVLKGSGLIQLINQDSERSDVSSKVPDSSKVLQEADGRERIGPALKLMGETALHGLWLLSLKPRGVSTAGARNSELRSLLNASAPAP